MDKLQMAHDHAMANMQHGYCFKGETIDKLVQVAHDYADAMYAEYEKRQDKSRPEVLDDFQVDWNQAPHDFNYWAVDCFGAYWYRSIEPKWSDCGWTGYQDNMIGSCTEDAPMFNYTGSHKESLRKRPD